ncbi:MAG: HAD family hydrolase [Candidatus Omnitrophica bacterium]|nr:HAD family hydrolase [Candidatus Omnitrophota bacterium]
MSHFKLFVKKKEYLKYRAAIFDLDNTLYDYHQCDVYARCKLFKEISKDYNLKTSLIKRYYEKARLKVHGRLEGTASMHSRFLYIQGVIETINRSTDAVRILKYHRFYWKQYFMRMKLFAWVEPLFKDLCRHNIKIAILTDFTSELQYEKIKRLSITRYVQHVVTSEESGAEKPSEIMMNLCMGKLKMPAKDIFAVGDDPVKDILGKRLGIKTFILQR